MLSESTLERLVMGKMYLHALFPNGDIDLHRDQVLTAHIKKLAQVITPQHRALRIPRGYLLECPWPSAQAAIATLNAYKVFNIIIWLFSETFKFTQENIR